MLLEESYIKFLIKHDLTQSQYLLLHLVHKKRTDLIRDYKEKFPTDDNTMIGKYLIDDLVKKGFLIEKDNTYKLTNKFLEQYVDKFTATEEIYDEYPSFFNKDGLNIPLKGMDRNIFANLYDKAISSSVLEHIEVMEDIKFGIEQGLMNLGIDKFIKSKHWLAIRPHRLAGKIREDIEVRRDFTFDDD